MALTDDLDAFFSSGGTTGKGILDQPTEIEIGGQVLFVDYQFHCKVSDFGTLNPNDSITIDGDAYTVRSNTKDVDSLTTVLAVQKT